MARKTKARLVATHAAQDVKRIRRFGKFAKAPISWWAVIEMKEDVIERAVRAVLDAAPRGSRVVLFGSHARGSANPDSDLDILVIEPEVENRFDEIIRLRQVIGNALGDTIQPVDLLVTDEARFRRKAAVPNTLAYEAAKYGVVYE